MSVVKIDTIKPFNEIWFKNCYYSAYFPIIIALGETIVPLLTNQIFEFHIDDYGYISFDEKIYEKEDEIENKLGIKVIKKIVVDDVIKRLKSSINKGNPVLLKVDCFYESTRLDTYKKIHAPHVITVYGYNDKSKEFCILDHDSINSIMYKEKTLPYSDIQKAYESFTDKYMEYSEYSYYEYEKKENIDVHKIEELYKNNYIKKDMLNEYKLRNLLYCIDKADLNIKKLVCEKDLNGLNNQLNKLNELINNKKAEYYILKCVGYSQDKEIMYKKSIQTWSLIRAIIAKFVFSKNFKETAINVLNNKLDELRDIESSYYNDIFSYFDMREER